MLDIRCILFQSKPISKKTYFKELFEVVCWCHSKLFCLDVDQKLWSPFFNEIGFNCIKLSSKKVCSPILSREKKKSNLPVIFYMICKYKCFTIPTDLSKPEKNNFKNEWIRQKRIFSKPDLHQWTPPGHGTFLLKAN